MNTTVSLVAAVGGLLILAIMLAAPWSTNATGQPARPKTTKREHKPATPALLETPAPRPPGAHRLKNTTDGQPSTTLVQREGPRKMYPGKPIKFTAS